MGKVPKRFWKDIERILPFVKKPARYIGNEVNSVHKPWDAVKTHFLLVFPDTYEVGLSNVGLKIIYDVLNSRDDVVCERAFAPWTDCEALLREHGIPLFSIESFTEARAFEIIGFSLQYEMCYTNVLNLLDLSDIPLTSEARTERDPLIVAGGPCTVNPEPVAKFIDAFVIGDGEEAVLDVVDKVQECRDGGRSRADLLRELAAIEGVYVPSLYDEIRTKEGVFSGLHPLEPSAPATIRKRVVKDLDSAPFPTRQVVPFIETVHDRFVVEIMRGCPRRCRFCQATTEYAPVRYRSIETIQRIVTEGLAATGYDELSLASLSSADHPDIENVVSWLCDTSAPGMLSVSLPSLRVSSFSLDLAMKIAQTKRTGLTFAPEAGSARLRAAINKEMDEGALDDLVFQVFRAGWRTLKLYFMIGLPGETQEDLDGIVSMARSAAEIAHKVAGRRTTINVSISAFVPKPHTAFQWEPMVAADELRERSSYIRRKLKARNVKLSWRDARLARLEALFARGDRLIGEVLLEAWRRGAKFDAWTAEINHDAWDEAQRSVPTMSRNALEGYAVSDTLPWQHIDCGISQERFLSQRRASYEKLDLPLCAGQAGVENADD